MPTINSGDTLSGIASRYGTTVNALMQANPSIRNPNSIYAGQNINLPGSSAPAASSGGGGGGSYTVRSGDTLGTIGARFGVSYQAIARANGISNPNHISVGQRLVIPGKSAPAAPAASSSGGSYTVRSGDTLGTIGARFGVSYQAIARANGISNPNHISVGQRLVIPGAGGASAPAPKASGGGSYTVRSGDTLGSIGARFGVSYQAIARANGIANPNHISVGQRLVIPGGSGPSAPSAPAPSGGTTYTVRSGDTLGGIGARYGVSYQAIARANGISNPNHISVGQRLVIPGGSGPSAPAPSAPAPSSSQRYTVRSGDTLGAIGARFGVSYQAIAQANGIANPNHISVGQVLTIPGGNAAPSGPVSGPGPTPGPVKGGISLSQLRAIMPTLPLSRANQVLPHLNKAMVEGGINTPRRQAAFLAQLAHESVQLRYFEEIASGAAYEGRRDLGNIYPGDGVRYKGRGPIQLTGRSNYRAAGAALGLDLENNPTRAADVDVGFRIAVWFWNSRNLSAAADANNFDYITYRINGGYNGKADRDRYWATARSVLGA